jgi:hypothetical protein
MVILLGLYFLAMTLFFFPIFMNYKYIFNKLFSSFLIFSKIFVQIPTNWHNSFLCVASVPISSALPESTFITSQV